MTPDPLPSRSTRLVWVVAVALVLYAAGVYVQIFRIQAGIDFYHFWGIAEARQLSAEPLGTPYAADAARYATVLNAAADTSSDPHLKRANKERRAIDPTATPLLYMLFSVVPGDYSSAHTLYRALQFAALIAAITWLCRLLGGGLAPSLALAGSVPIVYQPFQSEMAVGNVNSLQLLACVALAALARHVRTSALAADVLACALAAFVLFKPNLLLVAVLLGLCLVAARGIAGSLRPLALAVVCAAALWAWSSLWLGTWSAWPEWLAFVRGTGDSKLADYPVGDGNYAAVILLRGDSPSTRSYLLSVAIAPLLALSFLAAAFLGRGSASVRESLATLLADPFLLVSTALLVGLAASPLVWFHYTLLALFPCVWLALSEERFGLRSALALFSLAAYSCVQTPLLAALGYDNQPTGYLPWVVAFAWVPAWCALLGRIARGPI